MARRNRRQAGGDAGARRRPAPAATNETKEGQEQVFGFGKKGKKDQERRGAEAADRVIDQFGKNSPLYQRYLEMSRETIRLEGNGAEMTYHDYRGVLLALGELQEKEPDQFAELVRRVRPRGATRLPPLPAGPPAWSSWMGENPGAALGLKDRGFLVRAGGYDLKPEPRIAAVLDAAYTESEQGVTLREAAIYPSPEFAEKLDYVRKNWPEEVVWLAVDDVEAQLKKHGRGEGPAR